jgi:methylated-DNA-[protein]-cysteine S-methyltransferase
MSSPDASLSVATQHGPFTAITDARGAVLASGWTGEVDELVALVHPALRPEIAPGPGAVDDAALGRLDDAVLAYHDGDLLPAASVPVRQRGGEFTEQVWARMREVVPGAPVTYGELAERVGRPLAVRAIGVACARNAATLFVPCHRVLGSGGRVTGFRWGTELAVRLLEHEAAARETRECRTPEASSAP